MLKLVICGTIMMVASANLVSESIISEIRSKTTRWVPTTVEENIFKGQSKEDISRMMCLHKSPVGQEVHTESEPSGVTYDAAFDSRTQWPDCIHPIRDQAQCGSCWAFAATEALSDRLCIAGGPNVVLSPQDMVSCDNWNMGCSGGNLWFAWIGLQNRGVTTEDCLPYTSATGSVESCPKTCADGSAIKRFHCKNNWSKSGEAIKGAIQSEGPVETGFTVYEDFMTYKSGVYHHVSGAQLGGHAVKIIGWGSDDQGSYWICANSWGASWGEAGFFRIAAGDSGIDAAAYACEPNLTTSVEILA
jgi:cathepsin B